jgi:AcrR family transcriptional regulator
LSVKRAYDSIAKEARRQDILNVAERLFAAGGDQLPSVSRIAEAAGLAKGTVYLYFGTKEEIFAVLLLEGWSRIIAAASHSLADETTAEHAAAHFLTRFVAELLRNPDIMRLDAMGKAVLEGNMTADALAAFRSDFHQRLAAAGAMLEDRLGLPGGRGPKLLSRTHAMARGLWQSFGPSAPHAAECGNANARFPAELQEALAEYWRGALIR